MKSFFTLIIILTSSLMASAQTTWNVEVGGVPDTAVLPYYDPQELTINEGDIVSWTNVQGFHSIIGTQALFPNNPTSFSYPAQNPPYTFEFTFTIPGVYDYECTVGSHSNTQFGTITVLPANNIGFNAIDKEIVIAPMPFHTTTTIAVPEHWTSTHAVLYALNGEVVRSIQMNSNQLVLDRSGLENGIYILQLTSDHSTVSRKVVINRGE
jgi:plastocyanin